MKFLRVQFLSLMYAALLSGQLFAYDMVYVLDQLEAKEKMLSTIQFSFSQDIQFIGQDLKAQVAGQVLFKKPGKVRIEKKTPQEQITISNGKKIWIYTPSYQQVWVGQQGGANSKQAAPSGILLLENYVEDLKKNYNLSLVENESPSTLSPGLVLKAIPKEDSGFTLDIYVSTNTWYPVETFFLSESSQIKTKIYDVQENPNITDALFSFQAPKGTDVIPLN